MEVNIGWVSIHHGKTVNLHLAPRRLAPFHTFSKCIQTVLLKEEGDEEKASDPKILTILGESIHIYQEEQGS